MQKSHGGKIALESDSGSRSMADGPFHLFERRGREGMVGHTYLG